MIATANFIAILFYFIAAGAQSLFLLNKLKAAPKRSLLISCGAVAVTAHGYSAIQAIYQHQQIDLGFFRMSSLISCFIAAISILNMLRRPSANLIVALFPLAALSIIGSDQSAQIHQIQGGINAGLFAHILSSILAYSLMTIAAMQAIALAMQERHLKHHHFGGILQRLPPLQTMEAMLFELIWVGMALLSISLISGVLFIDDLFSQHLAHKTFFSFAAWIIFAVLLWGRHQLGWRSKTAIRWTLGGFLALMLAYYGSKFVLEMLLTTTT